VIDELKTKRQGMRLSISALARKAKVSRFRLWSAEAGELVLTPQELARLRDALHGEAARIENIFRDFVRAEV
jgi:predicted transcriptional regulator